MDVADGLPVGTGERPRCGPPSEREVDFLLIGGGLASATAAETLRIEGATGSIVIVCAEDSLPYHRPPLSKRILLAEAPREPPLVLKEVDCLEHGIEILCGTRAIALKPRDHLILTDRAGALRYGKLLIATGGSGPATWS